MRDWPASLAFVAPVAAHERARARGGASAVVGEVDEDEDGDMDWSTIVAEPLKPVVH